MIGARLSSRSSPPSKAARVKSTTRGESPPVSFRASSLASPIVSPQLVTSSVPTSSAPVAIRKSSSPATPPAPHSCPPQPGAPTGAVQMLGKPQVIRDRLGRFVIPDEVLQITSLGTERVIDTFLEGLAQASTASVSLLLKAKQNDELKRENEGMRRELSIARKKIADFEVDRGASEAARERASRLETELASANERAAKGKSELLTTCERESRFETVLSLARERARRAEAESVEARERASLREAELVQARERASLRKAVVVTEMKAARDRASQAERELAEGVADAFIDGYEELRGKITAAFPHLDFSGFLPSEEPENTENGEEDEGDDEDDEGSQESS